MACGRAADAFLVGALCGARFAGFRCCRGWGFFLRWAVLAAGRVRFFALALVGGGAFRTIFLPLCGGRRRALSGLACRCGVLAVRATARVVGFVRDPTAKLWASLAARWVTAWAAPTRRWDALSPPRPAAEDCADVVCTSFACWAVLAWRVGMDSLDAPTSWSSTAATSTAVDDADRDMLPDAMLGSCRCACRLR